MKIQCTQRLAALLDNYRDALHIIDVGPCATDDRREVARDEARNQIFAFFDECLSDSASEPTSVTK